MKQMLRIFMGVVIASFGLQGTALSITPIQLKQLLDQGEDVTLIDIRSTALYTKAHIQNAINIPASIIKMKRIPDIGPAIVYGDGIRTDISTEAVEALKQKTEFQVGMLEGGFAAWESLNFMTTRAKGLEKKRFHYISYQDLKKVAKNNANLVLLDLRSESESLTDLSEQFPGLNTIRLKDKPETKKRTMNSSFPGIGKRPEKSHERLYILIDDGNGESEKMAGSLKSAGVGRVVILTGGEMVLKRDGRPGSMKKVTNSEVRNHK